MTSLSRLFLGLGGVGGSCCAVGFPMAASLSHSDEKVLTIPEGGARLSQTSVDDNDGDEMNFEELWETVDRPEKFSTVKEELKKILERESLLQKKFELESQDLNSCFNDEQKSGKFCFLHLKSESGEYKLKIDKFMERGSSNKGFKTTVVVKRGGVVNYWDENLNQKASSLTTEDFDELTSSLNENYGSWDRISV